MGKVRQGNIPLKLRKPTGKCLQEGEKVVQMDSAVGKTDDMIEKNSKKIMKEETGQKNTKVKPRQLGDAPSSPDVPSSRNARTGKQTTSRSNKVSVEMKEIFSDISLDQSGDFSGGFTPYKVLAKKKNICTKGVLKTEGTEYYKKQSKFKQCNAEKKTETHISTMKPGTAEREDTPQILYQTSAEPTQQSKKDQYEETIELGEKIDKKVIELPHCHLCGCSVSEDSRPKHIKECMEARFKFSSRPANAQNADQEKDDVLKGPHGYVFCQMCQMDLSAMSVEERTHHVNVCIDGDSMLAATHGPVCAASTTSDVGEDAREEQAICQMCHRDLTDLNSHRRMQHVNYCVDMAEKNEKEKKERELALLKARNKILDCPVCGKALKTQSSRQTHLKQCARTFNVSPTILRDRIKQQEEEHQLQLDAGILPYDSLNMPKNTRKKPTSINSRTTPADNSVPVIDEDTQLALALSSSLAEQLHHHTPAEVATCSTEADNEKRKDAFRILMTPKKSKPAKRNRKKKGPESVPILLLQTHEDVKRHLAEKMASLLSQPREELSCTPPSKESRLLQVSTGDYQPREDSPRWTLTKFKSTGGSSADAAGLEDAESIKRIERALFYVQSLRPYVTISTVWPTMKYPEMQMSSLAKDTPVKDRMTLSQSSRPGSGAPGNETLFASTQTAVYLAELAAEAGNVTINTTLMDQTLDKHRLTSCQSTSAEDMSPVEGGLKAHTNDHPSCQDQIAQEDRISSMYKKDSVADKTGFITCASDDGDESGSSANKPSSAIPNLVADLRSMVGNPVASDFEIETRDGRIFAHKFMIAARCPTLYQKLIGTSVLRVPWVDTTTIKTLLTYVYSGHSDQITPSAATLAQEWGLSDLKNLYPKQGSDAVVVPTNFYSQSKLGEILKNIWGSDVEESDSDSDREAQEEEGNETETDNWHLSGKGSGRKSEDHSQSQEKQYNHETEEEHNYEESEKHEEDTSGNTAYSGSDSGEEGGDDGHQNMSCRNRRRNSLNMTHADILSQLAALNDGEELFCDESGDDSISQTVKDRTIYKGESSLPGADSTNSDKGGVAECKDSTQLHKTISKMDEKWVSSPFVLSAGLRTLGNSDALKEETVRSTETSCSSSPERLYIAADSGSEEISRNQSLVKEKNTGSTLDQTSYKPNVSSQGHGQYSPITVEEDDSTRKSDTSDKFSHACTTEPTDMRCDVLVEQVRNSPELLLSNNAMCLHWQSIHQPSDLCTSPQHQDPPSTDNSPLLSTARHLKSNVSSVDLFEMDSGSSAGSDLEVDGVLGERIASQGQTASPSSSPVFQNTQRNTSSVRKLSAEFSIDSSPLSSKRMLQRISLGGNKRKRSSSNSSLTPRRKPAPPKKSRTQVSKDESPLRFINKRDQFEDVRTEPLGKEATLPERDPRPILRVPVESNLATPSNKSHSQHSGSPLKPVSPRENSAVDQDPSPVMSEHVSDCASLEEYVISSDSDLDVAPIDLTQDDTGPSDEEVPNDPGQPTPLPAPEGNGSGVWSDFDDAGYNEDFLLLKSQSPVTKQSRHSTAMSLVAESAADPPCTEPATSESPTAGSSNISPQSEPVLPYDPPTDIDTDASFLVDDNVDAASAMTSNTQAMKTPRNVKRRCQATIPSPFTPMADYENMSTPQLKANCKTFGLRALPKKKMVTMLKHIYQETHQYETDTEFEESFSEGVTKSPSWLPTEDARGCPRVTLGRAKDTSPVASQSSSVSFDSVSDDEMMEESYVGSQETGASSPTTDKDDLSQTQVKKNKIRAHILKNQDLYLKILKYEPIEIDEFRQELREAGVVVGCNILMDFLDEQNILFTLRKRKEQKGRRHRSPTKGRGRSPAKSQAANPGGSQQSPKRTTGGRGRGRGRGRGKGVTDP